MRRLVVFLSLLFLSLPVLAGGSPLRTLVVVNRNSDQSLELGRYYAELRGIPDRQIFSIATAVSSNIEVGVYSNEIEGPIRAYLGAANLSNTIDYVVFSMDIPYRVHAGSETNKRSASLTSAIYYGFFSSPNAFAFGCDLAAGSSNRFYASELAFTRNAPYSSNRYLLASMITASNLPLARRLVDQSRRSDGTLPAGNVFLLKTGDPLFRDLQWREFETAMYPQRFIQPAPVMTWVDGNSLSGKSNIVGVTAGDRFHNWISGNAILPGAIAEHLTSFAGCLFDVRTQTRGTEVPADTNQMSILDWILNGYVGSYGTVVEPCADQRKFPAPLYHYWYARGFNFGESLMMSLQNPYQGILVGDPLCAPFAVNASISFSGLTNLAVAGGLLSLTCVVAAADAAKPVTRMEWWMDGRFQGVLTNVAAAAGNDVAIEVNGTSRAYTVKSGDTLYSMVTGLVHLINTPPMPGVRAFAHGDQIELRQTNLGVSASGWTCQAVVSPGTASAATVSARVPFTNFLETALAAREGLSLSGTSKSGDVVRAVITRTDGQVFTNQTVVTTDGTLRPAILTGLANSINLNTNLQTSAGCLMKYVADLFNGSAEAWLFARTNSWESHNVRVDYQVIPVSGSSLSGPDFSDNFNDNPDVLAARAAVFLSTGFTQLSAAVSIDTTAWPDGPHDLTVVAREGTGVATESRETIRFHIDNHDVTCSIEAPPDGIFRLKTGILTVDVSAAVSAGVVTQLLLFAEGKPVVTGVTASLNAEIALADYGAGPLNLQAQAWADGNRSTVSAITTVMLYTDADGDGISDQWEFQNFISNTNFIGAADVDGDGYSNYEEFMADTQPTNQQSYFAIQAIDDAVRIVFPSSGERRYQVRFHDGNLIDGSGWYPTGSVFQGSGQPVAWTAETTNDLRFYAVEPKLPE